MQAAKDAVGNVREKGKSFLKPKYADQLLGSGLEEQIRRATAKNLPGPDLALNRRVSCGHSFGGLQALSQLLMCVVGPVQIVETINNDLNSYSAHVSPHKIACCLQGLAVVKVQCCWPAATGNCAERPSAAEECAQAMAGTGAGSGGVPQHCRAVCICHPAVATLYADTLHSINALCMALLHLQ